MAKVLLVEDDNNLREIYEARLTAEGYDIVTAQNGEEALSVAKQQKPDLVISDVMMPRISGFEMLDILRNTDELRSTKVIMLTALGQAEDRGRADNLGADKYLVKSQVTLEDIVNAAKALLSDEPGSITTPTAPPVTDAPPEVSVAPVQPSAAPDPFTTPSASPVAPEPTMAPVASEPVIAPIAPVPDPIAPTIPVQQTPITPAPTTIDQPVNTNVTVTDTDPIVPHISPAAEPLAVAEATAAAPPTPLSEIITAAQPLVATQTEAQAPIAELSSTEPQTLAAEEAAIEAQIASFAGSEVATAVPTPQQINNDAILEDAMNKLTAADVTLPSTEQTPSEAMVVSTEPAPEQPAIQEPSPEPIVTPDPAVDTTSQITGRKVIQPISDTEAGTPDIEALLAKEEAKEAASAETPPQPPLIDNEFGAAQKPGIDPNTIAL